MGQLTKNEIFALAVQRYSDTVFRAAMHNCSCTADAEDVVQDVFEKLLCYNGRFESEEHLKAWLLRVTINRCHDLTRAARQKDTELDENLPAPDQMEDGWTPCAPCPRTTAMRSTSTTTRGTPPPRWAGCWAHPPTRCSAGFAAPAHSYIQC